MRLSRRALIGSAGATVLASGCGKQESTHPSAGAQRLHYADDHDLQYADLRRPAGRATGTLVLLHGGYWQPGYGLDQLDSLATFLTDRGWVTWNVEYRPIGDGGVWPDPMTDVALAIDHLAELDLTENVVALGHSAGGQLAVWAASRTDATPGGPPQVRPRGAISLSGVLDLSRAASAPGSTGPVTALAGGTPAQVPEHYALSDPTLLAPASCPVWAVHAEDDQVVPLEQSTAYVDRAKAARGRARLVTVPGDHFSIIDTRAHSFPKVEQVLAAAAGA